MYSPQGHSPPPPHVATYKALGNPQALTRPFKIDIVIIALKVKANKNGILAFQFIRINLITDVSTNCHPQSSCHVAFSCLIRLSALVTGQQMSSQLDQSVPEHFHTSPRLSITTIITVLLLLHLLQSSMSTLKHPTWKTVTINLNLLKLLPLYLFQIKII